jgi:hypothetical protein
MGKPNDEYTVVAFYGIATARPTLLRAFRTLVAWFDLLKLTIDLAAAHGLGFSGKHARFPLLRARINECGFRNVESVELTALRKLNGLPTSEWKVKAAVSPKQKFLLIAADKSLASLNDVGFVSFVHEVVTVIRPSYGIGYYRALELDPTFNAVGIFSQKTFDPNAQRHIAQSIDNEISQEGRLRDIYLWNFLSQLQLRRRIGKLSLEEWINRDSARGALRPFGGQLSLWTISETQQSSVVDALWGTVIHDWWDFLQEGARVR